jgi:TrmH family RNA methyltransferase
LRELKIPVFAARPDAKLVYSDADYRAGAAIVLGSEAEGLSDKWSDAGVSGIRLPMRGIADSLNVSATAAVLFYEAQRQRHTY